MITKPIFFDNASTTKVDKEVMKSFEDVTFKYFGNTSSKHNVGYEANDLLNKARNQILDVLHLPSEYEVIFTSGATESNNLAVKGYSFAHMERGKHIITSVIEHPSVLNAFRQLEEKFGFEVSYIPVTKEGKIDLDVLKSSIRKDTILVSIMGANNETGILQPIKEIKEILKDYPKIAFHSDCVQTIGKLNVDYSLMDMFTITAHKIHGLKGIGALVKKRSITLLSMNTGGEQEEGIRSGTVNLAGAVSFAKAVRLAEERKSTVLKDILPIYSVIKNFILENPDELRANSLNDDNPYIINISTLNKKASVVVEGLSRNGIMVSSVSACSFKGEPSSYVIYEMLHDEELAHNTIRISVNENNTIEEAEYFVKIMKELLEGLRSR